MFALLSRKNSSSAYAKVIIENEFGSIFERPKNVLFSWLRCRLKIRGVQRRERESCGFVALGENVNKTDLLPSLTTVVGSCMFLDDKRR
jgi:hypothetical protein